MTLDSSPMASLRQQTETEKQGARQDAVADEAADEKTGPRAVGAFAGEDIAAPLARGHIGGFRRRSPSLARGSPSTTG